MTIELIVFVASILFGILLYWRESNGNGLYRFINKIVNSKELQMDTHSKKGFIYQQSFLLRLVYIAALFLMVSLVVQFFTPFKIFSSYNGISTFASSIVGTLLGTYIAGFVIKSGDVIEDKSDNLSDLVSEAIEKGKDIIEDLNAKKENDVTSNEVTERSRSAAERSQLKESTKPDDAEAKSARDRLKDKGLL